MPIFLIIVHNVYLHNSKNDNFFSARALFLFDYEKGLTTLPPPPWLFFSSASFAVSLFLSHFCVCVTNKIRPVDLRPREHAQQF